MFLLNLFRSNSFKTAEVTDFNEADFDYCRLEERRVLNASFAVIGTDLALDSFVSVDEVTFVDNLGEIQITLNSGTWNGADLLGAVTGNGLATLTLDSSWAMSLLDVSAGGVDVFFDGPDDIDLGTVVNIEGNRIYQDSFNEILVGGSASLVGSDIVLSNQNNDFGGAVSIYSSGDATLVDVNDLTLDTTPVVGSLTASGSSIALTGTVSAGSAVLTSTVGDITDSGVGNIQVTGTTTLNSTGDVILDNAGNDFGGAVSI
ncbi:MAG: hypothetical protein GY748_11230, partial [Planctomycetaceae bacterium]|nr:hypothetical protein [Planctomycetaceae bacterium]